jgi:hypothetical protein
MPGLPGGAHDLTDEAFRLGRAAAAVPNTAWTDMQLTVVPAHDDVSERSVGPTAQDALI